MDSEPTLPLASQAVAVLKREEKHGFGFTALDDGFLRLCLLGTQESSEHVQDHAERIETVLKGCASTVRLVGSERVSVMNHPGEEGPPHYGVEIHYTEWDLIPSVMEALVRLPPPALWFTMSIITGNLRARFENYGPDYEPNMYEEWNWRNIEHRCAAEFYNLAIKECKKMEEEYVGAKNEDAFVSRAVQNQFKALGSPKAWLHHENWNTHFGQGCCTFIRRWLGLPDKDRQYQCRINTAWHNTCSQYKILQGGSWPYPSGQIKNLTE